MAKLVVSVPEVSDLSTFEGLPVETVVWDMSTPADRTDIDYVVAPALVTPKILENLAGLHPRLVQWAAIGYDGASTYLPAGIPFANATSVHETATAELALALILASERQLPQAQLQQQRHQWNRFNVHGLADKRVAVLGIGGVGAAVIERLKPFEVDLVRVAHSERDDAVGHVFSINQLFEVLPTADVVVIALPLNAGTEGLVDDSFLAAMKDGSLLVNVGRGKIANTDALVQHAGRIRLALDVTDPEPLPEDHPLWDAPETIIAPHLGGLSDAKIPRERRLRRRQAEHLLAGEEPENVVIQ